MKAKEWIKYTTTIEVAKWVYDHVGPICRNLDGLVCIDGKPAIKQDIFDIYNAMVKEKLPIVMSRIEDVLQDPRWFDYRQGPHIRFPESGWLNNEKYFLKYVHDNWIGLYKVRCQPQNQYCVRIIIGGEIKGHYFARQSEAIEFFNNQQNEVTLTLSQFKQ